MDTVEVVTKEGAFTISLDTARLSGYIHGLTDGSILFIFMIL